MTFASFVATVIFSGFCTPRYSIFAKGSSTLSYFLYFCTFWNSLHSSLIICFLKSLRAPLWNLCLVGLWGSRSSGTFSVSVLVTNLVRDAANVHPALLYFRACGQSVFPCLLEVPCGQRHVRRSGTCCFLSEVFTSEVLMPLLLPVCQ